MTPPTATGSTLLRIGIVGAGRSRNGLGPYLASAFEAAGACVVGVAGRDMPGAERAAAALAQRLGHAVAPMPNADALAAAVDCLVVAAPVEGHLAGLDAALAAGVPCLCEKPLVAAADLVAGLQRIAAFRARGLLLVENCQWPEVLPALFALHPELQGSPVRRIAMGLSPSAPGPGMVADSLSHVLSVAQSLAELRPDALPADMRQQDAAPDAQANLVTFRLAAAHGDVEVALHLQVCPTQPRLAWLEVDGRRIDRRIDADYRIAFVAPDGRAVAAEDPLFRLVYGVRRLLPHAPRERAHAHADAIDLRLRLYASVVAALGHG